MKRLLVLFGIVLSGLLFAQDPEFIPHQIELRGTALGQTYAIDMDNDGDIDIGVGSGWMREKTVWWYENTGGDASTWT